MTFTIGREPASSQLNIVCGNARKAIGNTGSVPQSVSRQHLELTQQSDGTFLLRNIKPQNITFVDGREVEQTTVKRGQCIELGGERYLFPWKEFLALLPKEADISHLRLVWDEYQEAIKVLNNQQTRLNALKGFTPLISMAAMLMGFIGPRGPLFISLYVLAFAVSAYFAVISYINASKIPAQKEALQTAFEQKYVCPECGYYFGAIKFELFPMHMPKCPHCHTTFITK